MTSTTMLIAAWVGAVAAGGWFIAATLAEAYAAEEQLRDISWTAWQSASLAVAIVLLATAVLLTVRAARRSVVQSGAAASP